MKIFYDKESNRACRTAAEELKRWANRQKASGSGLIIGVPGGRSITPMLTALVDVRFSLAQSTLFLADERALPDGDPERNDGQIIRTLRDTGIKVGENGVRLERPVMDPDHPDRCAAEYTKRFQQHGSVFDLLILGVGEDGHVASLFPNAPGTTSSLQGYLVVSNSPKPPRKRISISPGLIRSARMVVLLAFGEGKQGARSHLAGLDAASTAIPASLALAANESMLITDLTP